MKMISKINMDLMIPGYPPVISGVQDDRYTRQLELSLTADGETWTIPSGVSVLVYFSRADGSGGKYDVLPDGSKAWKISGNVITVDLAPQVLSVPGPVNLWITLLKQEVQLSTFAVVLNVQPKAGENTVDPAGYVNVTGFLPGIAGAVPGQFLRIRQVDGETGYVTAVEAVDMEDFALLYEPQTLTEEQKQQARENMGAMSSDAAILPAVTEKDDHKVLMVENGRWTAAMQEGTSYNMPLFDLGEMGMPPLSADGGQSSVQTDTTALSAALDAGVVKLAVPVSDGDQTMNMYFTMSGFSDGNGMHMCYTMLDTKQAAVIVQPGVVAVIMVELANAVGFPAVTNEDNNKIMQVVEGRWAAVEAEAPDVAVPVFDLGAMGMGAVTATGGSAILQTDTSEMEAALNSGVVRFAIPFENEGETVPMYFVMSGITDGSDIYLCTSLLAGDTMQYVALMLQPGMVAVMVAPLASSMGLPTVTEADNDKIMQVVNGVMTAVSVEESVVKTYVYDYIRSALEGDY